MRASGPGEQAGASAADSRVDRVDDYRRAGNVHVACVKVHQQRPKYPTWPCCGSYTPKVNAQKLTEDPRKIDCRKCLYQLLRPPSWLLHEFKMNGKRWPGAWPKGYVRSHVELEPLVLQLLA